MTYKSIDAIFDAAQGSGAMAQVLKVKPSAASEMRRRNSIPVQYWPRLVAHFQAIGKDLTNDDLVAIHVTKRRKPSVKAIREGAPA